MPLVLCTSPSQNLAEHDDLLRRLRVALVPKPFDIDYLLDVIEELLPLSERDESGSVDTTGT